VQQLHLVGFTADYDGLIFSARRGSKSGGFVVPVDDRFIGMLREVLAASDEETDLADALGVGPERRRRRSGRGRTPAPESALSPRDIQARLRAGRSASEVAHEAGVDDAWVLRFAAPVLAEQSRIIDKVVELPCRTVRKGESAQPLGSAVAWNLIERGIHLADDELARCWGTHHVRDDSWLVRFRYMSRGRPQVAQWEYDAQAGTVIALNRLATELGYVEPGRRRPRPSIKEAFTAADLAAQPPVVVPLPQLPMEPEPEPAPRRAGRKRAGGSRRPSLRGLVGAKKAAAKKVAAKKAAAKKVAATKAAAKKALRKPPPTKATRRRVTRSKALVRAARPKATRPAPKVASTRPLSRSRPPAAPSLSQPKARLAPSRPATIRAGKPRQPTKPRQAARPAPVSPRLAPVPVPAEAPPPRPLELAPLRRPRPLVAVRLPAGGAGEDEEPRREETAAVIHAERAGG